MPIDITDKLAGLRGDEYVAAVRLIAAQARERSAHLRCAGDGCTEPAVWLGMQRCGAPGPPVCDLHRQRHDEWMASAVHLGQPFCRHCGQDVSAEHIYVVSLAGDRDA